MYYKDWILEDKLKAQYGFCSVSLNMLSSIIKYTIENRKTPKKWEAEQYHVLSDFFSPQEKIVDENVSQVMSSFVKV